MSVQAVTTRQWGFHPVHALLVAAAIPLLAGALLTDIAYWRTHEVQWSHFSSWLVVGGVVILAVALVAAIVGLFADGARKGLRIAYFLLLFATFVLGLVNALVHAKDAWAVMPEGLLLSAVVAVLACIAQWLACLGLGREVLP